MPISARQLERKLLRPAFTLVELLVVMGILAMMASMVLVGLSSAAEQARLNRTRSQIQKIHELLMPRWEEYRYRRVPPSSAANPRLKARDRVDAIRALMRMEMPCHIEDVKLGASGSVTPTGDEPALWNFYQRRVMTRAGGFGGWTISFDDAECLYMILESIQDGDTNGLDYFKESEFGDLDGDGMPEILDGWGRPIRFLRWAPGFIGVRSNLHRRDAPDPLDPLNVRGGRGQSAGTGIYDHFPLYPLVISAGPDEQLDIPFRVDDTDEMAAMITGTAASPVIPNDPYIPISSPSQPLYDGRLFGEEFDVDADGYEAYFDNISNHQLVIAGNDQ